MTQVNAVVDVRSVNMHSVGMYGVDVPDVSVHKSRLFFNGKIINI
jgi:hypothetical protein